MKRIIICIFVIILGLVLIGCSNSNEKDSNNELNQEENLYDNFITKNDPAKISLNIDKINCSLKYSAKGFFGHKYNDEGKTYYFSQAFIKSENQLVELCNEYNRKTFNDNNTENQSELNTLLQSFDEDYFLDKTLLFFLFGQEI